VLTTIQPELDKLNIGLIGIGSGTPVMALNFKEEYKFGGTLYVDQKRLIYQALGCNRGLKFIINTKVLAALKTTKANGYSNGKTEGDAMQLGGAFVISNKDGVIYQHLEEYAGHHADNAEILKACKQYRNVN